MSLVQVMYPNYTSTSNLGRKKIVYDISNFTKIMEFLKIFVRHVTDTGSQKGEIQSLAKTMYL